MSRFIGGLKAVMFTTVGVMLLMITLLVIQPELSQAGFDILVRCIFASFPIAFIIGAVFPDLME